MRTVHRIALVALVGVVAGCASTWRPSGDIELPPLPRARRAAAAAATAPATTLRMAAPMARVAPTRLEKHGDVRIDDYYWLRERENPEVIRYLEAENAYTEATLAPSAAQRKLLFDEIVARIDPLDPSVPYRLGDYDYYSRYEEGREYPIYCRKRSSPDSGEEIMLDVNELAVGEEFLSVRGLEVSDDQQLLAFSVDNVGRRIYTIRFKDLRTGKLLDDAIPDATGNLAWAADNRTLFYTKQDPETLRWYRVFRHVLGRAASEDELVFEEADDTFQCGVWRSKSRRYVMLESSQTLSSEVRYIEASKPTSAFRVIEPRQREHEYQVDHYGDAFYIRTNDDAKNFRLMKTPVTATGRTNWTEVIPHRDDVLLEGFEIFKDFLVIEERKQALVHLRVRPWDGSGEHEIDFGEPAYRAKIDVNKEFDTPLLRYAYSSLTTPQSVYDYDMTRREKTLKKRDKVLGGFDPADYRTERLWASASDGTQIPMSLVHRIGMLTPGGNPLLQYGYGSYGSSVDASFRSHRLSILDRGFVFAICHIRGGEELGRRWYEDGKLLAKQNTFTDFIACSEHLIETGWARREALFALGGSAGGLLMGAIINMRPDLYRGVVAAVPFVDVITTMLDDTIPLTTSEYDEWGNPNDKVYYDYMLSYSPYDQVVAQDYPNMLVTAGLHDSQVQYWEPAKWVAKLRALKTDSNWLFLRTNMDAGHGGKSGRYRRYEETALEYAFMLHLAGVR